MIKEVHPVREVVNVSDSDRHFILACKGHYGDRVGSLYKIVKDIYGVTPSREWVIHHLLRIVLKYKMFPNDSVLLDFMEDVLYPSRLNCLLDYLHRYSTTKRALIRLIGVISNWQVFNRLDGIHYVLGDPDRAYDCNRKDGTV